MSFGGAGAGAGGALRFARGRGRIQGSMNQGLSYPSPFFDIAHTYLPATTKQMLRWCRYYMLVNPLINAVVFKMSEYPVTDIVLDVENEGLKEKWKGMLLDHLGYRKFQVEVGLDYHCLGGSTRVITENGVFPIKDLKGDIKVLSQDGVYRKAHFKSYGNQELWEVHTTDGVMLATGEHLWPVGTDSDGKIVKKTTKELSGRSLYRTVAPRPPQNDDFWAGVRHGIIFGDGTLSNQKRQAHVLLHTKEKRVLARYFESCATITPHHSDKYLGVYGLPPHYKKMPEESESISYWYGFVCGLLATDGCVDNRGQAVLTQKDRSVLLTIAEKLPWLGMLGGRVREHWAWNSYTKRQEPMNYLSLKTQYVQLQDLIRPDQRARFEEKYTKTNYGQQLRVKKVVPTGRVEEVFCCEEPETNTFVIENGVLTGNCYGNAFVSISFPFHKYLQCTECKYRTRIQKASYTFRNFKFHWYCKRCNNHGVAEPIDVHVKSARGIRLIRWNPEDIDISYNDVTGEFRYYYEIPKQLKNDIIIGKRDVIEKVPQLFINALRYRKAVVFSAENIFHFRRASLANADRGWGIPMILPVLKDCFYLQVLRKAQECLSLSTLMETSQGLIKADDVNVGDLVRTHTGRWRRVEKKWYRDSRSDEVARKITITGMRAFPSIYSPHHPIFSLRRNDLNRRSDTKDYQRSSVILKNPHLYEEVLCPAEQIQVGDYILYPKNLPSKDQKINVAKYTGLTSTGNYVYSGCSENTAEAFETLERGEWVKHDNAGRVAKRAFKEGRTPNRMEAFAPLTEDLSYVLGWYAGDGSCGSRHIIFNLGQSDNYTPLKRALENEFGKSPSINKEGSTVDVTLSHTIARRLVRGLIPGTARKKNIPVEVLNAPDKCKIKFLLGLWEADGYVDEKRASLSTSSKDLAYGAFRLLIHLGCIATILRVKPSECVISGRVVKGNGSFHVNVCGASRDRLVSLWECGDGPPILSGKSGFFWKDYFAGRVCAVEESEEDQFIDFKVAEDTTFCTPGMATKNSVALEHIVPLRVLHPAAGSPTSDPYSTVNLLDWKEQITKEIERWRYDCVSPDTLVETFDGLRHAEKIKEGDLLKTYSGKFNTVEKVWRRPLREGERAFRIKARGLTAVNSVFSEGHPFWAAKKFNNGNGHKLGIPGFIKVLNLRPGDYIGYPVTRKVVNRDYLDLKDFVDRATTDDWIYVDHFDVSVPEAFEFLEKNGPAENRKELLESRGWSLNQYKIARIAYREKRTLRRLPRFIPFDAELAWVVGLYLAEGNCTSKQIMFGRHIDEKDSVERLKKFFSHRFEANGIIRHGSDNGIQVIFSSKIAAEFFGSLCPGLSTTKSIPTCYKTAPDELVVSLLKGAFDGDGCWHEDGKSNHATYASASRQLIEDIRQLFLSLQIPVTLTSVRAGTYEIYGRTGLTSTSYRLKLNGQAKEKFLALSKGLSYSKEIWANSGVFKDGFFWHRIREIHEVELDEVIGFQMGPSDESVFLDNDEETHGTFCTWGMASANSNYIPVLPLPIGHQTIGGDGRALLLGQEMRLWSEQIVSGMGVPNELIFGGLSYSGSNVSLRMLENMFLGYMQDHMGLLKWIINSIGSYMEWPTIPARFKPFKMADDLQRKAYYFQLNQAGKLSDQTLLADSDFDSKSEEEAISVESKRRAESQRKMRLVQADIEGEAQMTMMRHQIKLQQEQQQMMQQPPQPGEPGAEAGGGPMPMQPPQGQQQQGQPPPEQAMQQQMAQNQQAMQQGQAPQGQQQGGIPQGMQSPMSMGSVQQLGPEGQPNAMGQVDLFHYARQLVEQYKQLTPDGQQGLLASLRSQAPELYDLVIQMITAENKQLESAPSSSASKPLPEQKPPRRGPESALI